MCITNVRANLEIVNVRGFVGIGGLLHRCHMESACV